MKNNWLRSILGLPAPAAQENSAVPTRRERLEFKIIPPLVYAVGDVHGCFDLLLDLETRIAADCADQKQPALIIMLGDYIDRGPASSEVIEHLLDPPDFNAKRICLAGNHEQVMLAFLQDPAANADWLEYGGRETLWSYGLSEKDTSLSAISQRSFIHKINSFIPDEHIAFLAGLPILVQFEHHIFVHAGLRPDVALKQQSDKDLVWIRDEFYDRPDGFGFTVVHGHTPNKKPFVSNYRINVDSGAFFTGLLSAAKFVEGEFIEFITT
ncbi:Serine/threonine protein phosphatase [hydrothermal vent metagenome]|uniref:Serine/threonine protein phosphatase n=1 Tax=hydrothermal vent metagenome TaxID=652676 RepID=A0A3B0U2Q3_9ZZZZ